MNVKTGVYTIISENEVKDIEFTYKTSLTANEKINFVGMVTNILVNDNYYSFLKGLIFNYYLVDFFTDVDAIDLDEETNNIKAIEDFINSSNIVDVLRSSISPNVIEELEQAVDDNLEYRTGVHINSISRTINKLIIKLSEKVDQINTEDINQLANIMGNMTGDITAEKLIDAYANSPIFAKSVEDRIKERENKITLNNK